MTPEWSKPPASCWVIGLETGCALEMVTARFRSSQKRPARSRLIRAARMYPLDHEVLPISGMHRREGERAIRASAVGPPDRRATRAISNRAECPSHSRDATAAGVDHLERAEFLDRLRNHGGTGCRQACWILR